MKKLLALVLALVMTLSLCVTSNAAFSDAADVNYDEAVKVLTAVGVFKGYEDGSFKPTKTLTRAEAAKLIAYLDLGEKTADALVGSGTVFSDVPATHWAAGYIEYCASVGYLAGVGEGQFNPSGDLTVLAYAKMLLCALGYDANTEGLTGTDWSINVSKLANKLGLLDNVDKAANAAVTREEAAQYSLDALKTTCVDYIGGSTMTVNGVTFKTGADRVEETSTKAYADAIDNTGNLLQLGEKLYEGKLVYSEVSQKDAFGRLAGSWFYDKDATKDAPAATTTTNRVVKSALKNATYTVTLTKNYDLSTIQAVLRKVTDNDDLTYSYDNDGNYVVNSDNGDSTEATEVANSFVKGNTVEVFCTGNTVNRVIVKSYKLAKITKVDTAVSAAQAKKGISAILTLKTAGGSSIGEYVDDTTGSEKTVAGYDAATYVKNAYIAVALDGSGNILDSYVVTPTTGKVESYKANDYFYMDGAKMSFAEAADASSVADDFSFTADYDVYATKEGYVLFVDGVSSATLDDVYYVTGSYKTETKGVTSYFVETVSMTGEVKDLQVEANEFGTGGAFNGHTGAGFVADAAGLYALTDVVKTVNSVEAKADNGKFSATELNVTDEYGSFTVKAAKGTLAANVVASSKYLTISDAKYYFNADTKFISVENANDSLKVKTADGLMKADATYATAYVIEKTSDTTKTANYVIYVGTDLSASNVAVDTSNTLYVKSASTRKATIAGTAAVVTDVRFMKDNSTDTVNVKASTSVAAGFYTYEINSDGLYVLAALDANSLDTEIDSKTDGYYANVGFGVTRLDTVDFKTAFDGVSYADATVVDLRSADDIEADTDFDREISSVAALNSAIEEIDTNENLVADVYVTDGEITFIAVKGFKSTVATLASVAHAGCTFTLTGNNWWYTGTPSSSVLTVTTTDAKATVVLTSTLVGGSAPTAANSLDAEGLHTASTLAERAFGGFSGKAWTVTVTAEDATTTATYTIAQP